MSQHLKPACANCGDTDATQVVLYDSEDSAEIWCQDCFGKYWS